MTIGDVTKNICNHSLNHDWRPGLWPVWTLGGAKSFMRGAQNFWTMSNSFILCPTHFSRRGEKISREGFAPPAPPWLRACWRHDRKISVDSNFYRHGWIFTFGEDDLAGQWEGFSRLAGERLDTPVINSDVIWSKTYYLSTKPSRNTTKPGVFLKIKAK